MSIRALKYQGTEFLFVAAHLSSKVHWSSSDQGTEAQVVASQLRRVEEKRGHNRTILVGDLNMNPFEDGVVAAAGLHAMMTKACVASRTRIVQGQEYPFFYNPMWSFFGDRNEGPPGTFYHHRSGHHVSYGWNIFDQVLFRPDVLPWFQADIEIVTKIGETELTGEDGRPNAEIGSDHFPLVFRLVPKG
jgi:endonuclease/exonuclease/phosphatase family metal-dependent hydrolase